MHDAHTKQYTRCAYAVKRYFEKKWKKFLEVARDRLLDVLAIQRRDGVRCVHGRILHLLGQRAISPCLPNAGGLKSEEIFTDSPVASSAKIFRNRGFSLVYSRPALFRSTTISPRAASSIYLLRLSSHPCAVARASISLATFPVTMILSGTFFFSLADFFFGDMVL